MRYKDRGFTHVCMRDCRCPTMRSYVLVIRCEPAVYSSTDAIPVFALARAPARDAAVHRERRRGRLPRAGLRSAAAPRSLCRFTRLTIGKQTTPHALGSKQRAPNQRARQLTWMSSCARARDRCPSRPPGPAHRGRAGGPPFALACHARTAASRRCPALAPGPCRVGA